jgi:hypothetical protein
VVAALDEKVFAQVQPEDAYLAIDDVRTSCVV